MKRSTHRDIRALALMPSFHSWRREQKVLVQESSYRYRKKGTYNEALERRRRGCRQKGRGCGRRQRPMATGSCKAMPTYVLALLGHGLGWSITALRCAALAATRHVQMEPRPVIELVRKHGVLKLECLDAVHLHAADGRTSNPNFCDLVLLAYHVLDLGCRARRRRRPLRRRRGLGAGCTGGMAPPSFWADGEVFYLSNFCATTSCVDGAAARSTTVK